MNLLIVESPNKVKKIRSILGDGWDVRASVGHIRDLPVNDLGVSLETFEPHYELTERGTDVLATLRSAASRASTVYLATDPDREGEAIAWHLHEALQLTTYQRVTFDAITPEVIKAAVASPRLLNTNLVRAQEARRVADRLVGYQVTSSLRQHTGLRGIAAGRVQSVAVRLVVERQREIKNFVPVKHYGARATFAESWHAEWDTATFTTPELPYVLDRSLADCAASCRSFRVTGSEATVSSEAPPPPFTTATLLQAASVHLGYSPAETARLAQRLFEQGAITYHRTDSVNLSSEAVQLVRDYAVANSLPLPSEPRRWKSKDAAQEAHEAIRPTHFESSKLGEDEPQQKLYNLIWQRALACQLADATYNDTKLSLTAEAGGKTFLFSAKGRKPLTRGWRSLTPEDATAEADDEQDADSSERNPVPQLAKDTPLSPSSTSVLEKTTRPPAAYTQASLIKRMEKEGIGRPSTYPSILTRIIDQGYVVEAKKKLTASDLAGFVMDQLINRFTFVNLDYTRRMERMLDEVATGRRQYIGVVAGLHSTLRAEITAFTSTPKLDAPATVIADATGLPTCPSCKKGSVRPSKNKERYFCDNYANGCKLVIFAKIGKKTITSTQVHALCTKGRTGVLKGFAGSSGKTFDAALILTPETNFVVKYEFPNKH